MTAKKTVGILGGMGPEATVHMFDLMVKMTAAQKDQEHIHIIIDNNPNIPDRSRHITHGETSPLPLLLESAERLERAGADFIIMPCHTAHLFYDEIAGHLSIPFLHMQEETLEHVKATFPGSRRFGLLATTGTVKKGMFQSLFKEKGEVIPPSETYQETVMEALFGDEGVKRGFKKPPRKLLRQVMAHFQQENVDAILSGCTEISLVLYGETLPLPLIDPMQIIAGVAIKNAGFLCK